MPWGERDWTLSNRKKEVCWVSTWSAERAAVSSGSGDLAWACVWGAPGVSFSLPCCSSQKEKKRRHWGTFITWSIWSYLSSMKSLLAEWNQEWMQRRVRNWRHPALSGSAQRTWSPGVDGGSEAAGRARSCAGWPDGACASGVRCGCGGRWWCRDARQVSAVNRSVAGEDGSTEEGKRMSLGPANVRLLWGTQWNDLADGVLYLEHNRAVPFKFIAGVEYLWK